MLIRSKTVFSLAIAILFGCQCVHLNAQETEGQADGAKKLNTIATELGSEEEFATLNTAIQAAGLDKALEGEGPFTVFAPTEEAFKKVGAETLEELLKEENKEKLIALLKAHVATGTWTAEKIADVSEIPTVDGGSLTVTRRDDKMLVGSATIKHEGSIKCENGLVHCIDEVLPAR